MGDIRHKLVEMVERMPAFPKSVHRILQLTADINCAPKDLVQVIEHDPVLTLKILKLVNSAYFGLARKVTSINHAVVYLGINTIKNLAISVATIGALPRTNKAGLNTHELLLHSLTTATIARMLARRLLVPDMEHTDYFVAGLLHDVGQIMFAQSLPQEYALVLAEAESDENQLIHVEQRTLGTTHPEVGAFLVEKWQFPAELAEAIRLHHDGASGRHTPLSDSLYLANHIAGSLRNEPGEDIHPGPLARFGVSFPELVTGLGDLTQEIEKAKSLIQL